MATPNQYNEITSDLHNLSSLSKLSIIGFFWFFINFSSSILPNVQFKNHGILGLIMTVTFATNILTEYIIYYQKTKSQDFHKVLEIQIILNTILLLFFLAFFDHINGPLFLLCLLTLMESTLNLNNRLLVIVVSLMAASTILEWIALILVRTIPFNLLNVASIIVRLVSLLSLSLYGRSLSNSIIVAKEVDSLKDDFISVASHELRTPMTAIKSYLWMALNKKGKKIDSKKMRHYLSRSYNATDRLIKLVNDMLNISRIESGRMSLSFEKTSLYSLTKEVVESFSHQAKKAQIKIMVLSKNKKLNVISDPDKIKEVFFNLIGNAIKFTPKNGKITIRFRRDNNFIITSITDTGHGMSKENINNLFTKFGIIKGTYQTNQVASASAQGTGLGLYICKQIIDLHQGKILGESSGPNQGSTFSFSLPAYTFADLQLYQKQYQHSSNVGIVHSKINQ